MRPSAAVSVLLAGLLTGGLIASGATPAHARPQPAERVATTLSTRLAPPIVTAGEPAALVVRASPATTRPLTVQQRVDGAWTTLTTATTTAAGRALVPLDASVPGTQELRVVAPAQGNLAAKWSTPVKLTVYAETTCVPTIKLVDPLATTAANCLVKRLDRWKAAGLMGVGQQLNVSNIDYLAPLDALGARRVSVVGFDLKELADGETYQFPTPPLDKLVDLARNGAVLSASWHPDNPHGGSYNDRSWHDLAALLDSSTPEYATFWADYEAKLALLRRFQDAGVAVVFRPLHEANGGWFWWGHPDPATYRKVWAQLQARAKNADVHNIVWAYSFNAVTGKNVTDPLKLLPARVDLAGIDSYDPEFGKGNAPDALPMGGYAAVAAKVKRMAITEAGPYDSRTGAWNPATITRTANAQRSHPIWSMLWYDDYPDNNPRFLRQISSLTGWRTWLDTCAYGFCPLS